MLVSIGVPTYNRADNYLKESLESALLQSYSPLEIIVADNCSTDHTKELVESYNDNRVRYVRHKRPLKPHENFNFCADQAKGKYFLLLHDDDLIDPDFIETCMSAINSNRLPGLVRTGARVIAEDGKKINESWNNHRGKTIYEFIESWFESKTALFLCSTLFYTKGLREIGGFRSKTNLYLDVVAEIRLAAKYGYIDIQDVKASFRRHGSNYGTTNDVEDWVTDSLYLLDIFYMMAPERREIIKEKGLVYFTKQNYKRASRIQYIKDRWVMYLKIYKSFDYMYSPLHYWLPRFVNLKSKVNGLKRRLKLYSSK